MFLPSIRSTLMGVRGARWIGKAGDRQCGSMGTGGGLAYCLGALLFDIVVLKEGMRGRRSPDADIGLVSCSGL